MLQGSDVQTGCEHSSRRPSTNGSPPTESHAHEVQFYESEAFLVNRIARFALAGLSRGEPVIVVATKDHTTGLVDALRAKHVDVEAACDERKLVLRDAHDTLASIVEAGMPNLARFEAAFHDIVEQTVTPANGSPRPLRVYGEMVDLLWKDGNAKAAIRLEELWNERLAQHDFSLLCAYAIRGFPGSQDGDAIAEICRQHTRVTPTERFVERDSAGRRVEIVLLQQRAQALETELGHRKELERRLRRAASAARSAKAAADVASRARSQFLTVMSHELRTPLNAIGGYAELLGLGILGAVSDDQRDSLERIQRNHRDLLRLINQVLDYSRLETGGLQYDITNVVVSQALAAAEIVAVPKMTAAGLRYEHAIDAGLIVHADRDKLQQILFNLFSNATKFTPEGGTIEVSCSADDRTVYIAVRDTGVGIPAARVASIFEPFVQGEGGGEAGYTRTNEGIGLGLAISRELARGMDGALTVQSTQGSGSTFTLALPRLVR